ncbi:hypothetical protein [Mucilaginibacter myungsuensis]|uniref:Uncharacterized protein n=1 Tax=Mucilaginibacter myungsuensis TaxID=649104 RepID=A0A929KUR5_9SPHI|nr:hypothetical protein [Mucilaginibacter myungsuensis]MBE9661929.1 hypothetical protein [Mucilaginibacter myungsuensis]MDN3599637.1 hypothetical protein [Mucilaginibacter myungsuensis]
MTINNKHMEFDEFAKKFIDTLSAGLRQMTEKAAANNESLVIGNIDGTSRLVPAKELLKTLPKK